VSDDPAALRGPLETWLADRVEGAEALRLGEFDTPTGGFSATTLLAPMRFRRDGSEHEERIVLRMETPEPAIYPAQAPGLEVEVAIQYRSMDGLRRATSAVPVAPLLGYEPDASVLGAPFFVMGFVAGQVPRENPLYTQEGFFVEASPEERRRMLDDGLRVLAEIHRIDWKAAGFEWLAPAGKSPGMAAQLAIWEAFARRELGDRVHPLIDASLEWLHANLPPDREEDLVLSWGDARPGNIIWQDFRCGAVTDFENIAIGPPELDLGWWLMFDRWSHETYGVPRLAGEPTREEQRDRYVACAGREIRDTLPYEIFAAMRYAAIVVRVMNRMVDRGDLQPDQQIWLQNPAATCLEQLLEEL
jgi:aminoglycoside phosphotransferase (APT) family kinase protein